MQIYSIETGNFKMDGGAMFGVVPKVLWSQLYPSDSHNLCNWAMRSLLIKDGERTILIDSGMGDKQDDKFLKHFHRNGSENLLSSLAAVGVKPEDITDHILTHLHFDHVGGSVTKNENGALVPTFRNATYWISRAQWNWANKPNNREKASFLVENIQPIGEKAQLKLIEEEQMLSENISLRLYNGHTDGQIIPFIKIAGRTLCFMADLLPSTAHIPLPYIMSYDTRPLITLKEKETFFNEAVAEDYTLFLQHDLYHECCALKQTEKGVRLKESFPLSAFLEAL